MTHDYKRHGTTSLFVAMDVASGEVTGETYRRHRHQEVLRFFRKVEKEVPKGREIHIILDNYATHKHQKLRNTGSPYRGRARGHMEPREGARRSGGWAARSTGNRRITVPLPSPAIESTAVGKQSPTHPRFAAVTVHTPLETAIRPPLEVIP